MKKLIFFLVVLTVVVMYKNTFSTTDIELLRQAAEQGDAVAQFQLGTAYYTGQSVQQDFQEAIKWYRKVAEQGFAIAQHNLGLAYSRGEGVPQDDKQAAYWYRKAAEQGDRRAQNNLGNLYRMGKGVPQDYVEAIKWYRKSAEQGNPIAQYNLSVAYDLGQGVPQNKTEAIKWYQKASEQEQVQAQKQLLPQPEASPSTAENLSATQVAEPIVQPQPPIVVEKPIETSIVENQPVIESEKPKVPLIELSKTLPRQTTLFALDKYHIALNYSRKADQAFITQLAHYLKEEGYTVDKVGRVNLKIYKPQWDIRYYFDRDTAMLLRENIKEFMQSIDVSNKIDIKIRDFSFMLRGSQKIKKGRIEVWILNSP